MTDQPLGRLERVHLREIWRDEARMFTPWLAREENLVLLGSTLSVELELRAQEQLVGPYRADIVCTDTADDSLVLIENQLNATDHCHLGQILTYAAGLGAATIVWIAERFTDEHRAALDWLNEVTGEKVRFFGLEVEVWRIGDSARAPKFNVVAKPNDWTKGAAGTSRSRSADLTEAKRLQLEFWTGFREYVLNRGDAVINPTKPLPQHWMNIAVGRTGFKLAAIASMLDSEAGSYESHELRAEFVIHDPQNAKGYYRALEQDRSAIDQEAGHHLIWHSEEDVRMCRIFLRRQADLRSSEARDEQYAWLLDKLEILHRVFAPRVRDLQPEPEPGLDQDSMA